MPSAIGDVVPALGAVITAALAAEPTTVYVGPKPTSDSPTEYVTVAFDPGGDTDWVTTDQEISDLGNRWVDESGDVICSATAWSGDSDTTGLLARVDDLIDLIDAALKANPTLSGVLVNGAKDGSYARVLGKGSMRPASTADGAIVRQTFTVHYSTLLV